MKSGRFGPSQVGGSGAHTLVVLVPQWSPADLAGVSESSGNHRTGITTPQWSPAGSAGVRAMRLVADHPDGVRPQWSPAGSAGVRVRRRAGWRAGPTPPQWSPAGLAGVRANLHGPIHDPHERLNGVRPVWPESGEIAVCRYCGRTASMESGRFGRSQMKRPSPPYRLGSLNGVRPVWPESAGTTPTTRAGVTPPQWSPAGLAGVSTYSGSSLEQLRGASMESGRFGRSQRHS